jgi:hypothetical protein
MGSKFEYLEPTKEKLPIWPHHHANSIAWRARSLIYRRSTADVKAIATDSDHIIEAFFDYEMRIAKDEISNSGYSGYVQTDDEGHFEGFTDEAYEKFNIRDKENTGELDALQEGFDSFFDPSEVDVLDIKEYEYFAVWAISKLDDYIRQNTYKYDFASHKYVPRAKDDPDRFGGVSACNDLLEAMEAVSYAERLRAIESIKNKYEQKIEDLKSATVDASVIREQVKLELVEEDKKIKQEASAAKNDIRHAKNRSIKQMVLDELDKEWAANRNRFPSAEKAADHFFYWLEDNRGSTAVRSHRTVAGWIRVHAKNCGVKFRV